MLPFLKEIIDCFHLVTPITACVYLRQLELVFKRWGADPAETILAKGVPPCLEEITFTASQLQQLTNNNWSNIAHILINAKLQCLRRIIFKITMGGSPDVRHMLVEFLEQKIRHGAFRDMDPSVELMSSIG